MATKLTWLPQPRHLEMKHGTYVIASGKTIALLGAPAQDLLFTAERLQEALQCDARTGLTVCATQGAETAIVLRVAPDANASPESYTLDITRAGVEIVAPSPRGIFYGVCTLMQILTQSPNHSIPCLFISDAPDFPNRGVMWDVSRTRVPELETLFELIDLLATWKINQIQLYTEHTFAYRQHRVVWENASPLTAQDILQLDAFCRARYIELVPNQNSFGHAHRWLRHPAYLHLAEFPEGYADTKIHWWAPSAFGLNPTDPRTLDFLRGLYDELLPNFSSRYFNVGLDETIDLGLGKSKAEVKARGVGAVYLDFLKQVHAEVAARGKTMMFWGDIITHHPELISQLPHDVIAMEWGYEANHPFDAHGAQFAHAGIPFYVCPGTSSWISILGRTGNAIENIRNATAHGLKHGAIGVLNTDWGDWGHGQMLPISYLGLAYGAALSWGVAANRDLNLPRALDLFAFRDEAGVMGRAAYELGNVYRALGVHYHNASGLARVMYKSLDEIRSIEGQTRAGFVRALRAIDKAAKPLARARMAQRDGELIQHEFAFSVRLARHGARRGILAFEKNGKRAAEMKRALDKDLRALIKEYKTLWDARNRPGGFEESVGWMEKAREEYRK
ncbi:MAG: family 20 glycosylhydrolase [Chloroflexi bacterium]|nr:family 20 glycosylhydrolase [Chloroflexota bacterium]